MIWLNTSAFVLALVAVVSGVSALITSWRLTRAQESLRSTVLHNLTKRLAKLDEQADSVSKLQHELQRSTPAKIAAEVAELSEAVARLAETQRKFAGKFFQATRQGREQARADALAGKQNGLLDTDDDDELAAMLRLQGAPPAKPVP